MEVARDQVAQVHKGEIIIPARESAVVRSSGVSSFSHLVEAAAGRDALLDAARAPQITGIVSPNVATAQANLPSLDVGAWQVQHDMTANIHAGETVAPKSFTEGLTGALGEAGQGGGGDSYGDTNIHNHFHQVMPTMDHIMTMFAKAIRNGHPALRSLQGQR